MNLSDNKIENNNVITFTLAFLEGLRHFVRFCVTDFRSQADFNLFSSDQILIRPYARW